MRSCLSIPGLAPYFYWPGNWAFQPLGWIPPGVLLSGLPSVFCWFLFPLRVTVLCFLFPPHFSGRSHLHMRLQLYPSSRERPTWYLQSHSPAELSTHYSAAFQIYVYMHHRHNVLRGFQQSLGSLGQLFSITPRPMFPIQGKAISSSLVYQPATPESFYSYTLLLLSLPLSNSPQVSIPTATALE